MSQYYSQRAAMDATQRSQSGPTGAGMVGFGSILTEYASYINSLKSTIPTLIESAQRLQNRYVAEHADDLAAEMANSVSGSALERRLLEDVSLDDHVKEVDGAMKSILDEVALLEEEQRVIRELQREFMGRSQEAPVLKENVEEDLAAQYESHLSSAKQRNISRSEADKYHGNDSYAEFRELMFESFFPDKNFRFMGGKDDDEDDDLVVMGANENYTCPITQTIMTEPYTSQVCKHSFSHAIFDLIRQSHERGIDCPIPGCGRYLNADGLKRDNALARRVARWQRRQESQQ